MTHTIEKKEKKESNASKANPGIEIKLGGKTYRLVYTLYSFMVLDEKTGKNPLDGEMWANIRPKDIALLIWAGLLHEETELTVEAIAQQVTASDIGKLPEKIQAAFLQATPSSDEEKKSSQS